MASSVAGEVDDPGRSMRPVHVSERKPFAPITRPTPHRRGSPGTRRKSRDAPAPEAPRVPMRTSVRRPTQRTGMISASRAGPGRKPIDE